MTGVLEPVSRELKLLGAQHAIVAAVEPEPSLATINEALYQAVGRRI